MMKVLHSVVAKGNAVAKPVTMAGKGQWIHFNPLFTTIVTEAVAEHPWDHGGDNTCGDNTLHSDNDLPLAKGYATQHPLTTDHVSPIALPIQPSSTQMNC